MPPTLATSWDDSASNAESDAYGDVFWYHCVFIWRLLGCGLCGLGCGLYGLAALRQKVHLNICYLGHSWGAQGAIWDGLGRPCVPQGVQKYVPRDENGSNFEAFWGDFVVLWILMILMTVLHEIHVFAAGRRSKEGDF